MSDASPSGSSYSGRCTHPARPLRPTASIAHRRGRNVRFPHAPRTVAARYRPPMRPSWWVTKAPRPPSAPRRPRPRAGQRGRPAGRVTRRRGPRSRWPPGQPDRLRSRHPVRDAGQEAPTAHAGLPACFSRVTGPAVACRLAGAGRLDQRPSPARWAAQRWIESTGVSRGDAARRFRPWAGKGPTTALHLLRRLVLDSAVIRRVDGRRRGRVSTPALYLRSGPTSTPRHRRRHLDHLDGRRAAVFARQRISDTSRD